MNQQQDLVQRKNSNDYLGISGKNLFGLLNLKNIYLVPFRQDDPIHKPNSIVCDFTKVKETLSYASEGMQIQPILL